MKKSITKNVRFSPEEMNVIKTKSKALNMTTSKYIRTLVNDGKILEPVHIKLYKSKKI